MKRTGPNDPYPPPPSEEELVWFEQGKHEGPVLDNLRLCVTGHHVHSQWNLHAARIFAKDFVTWKYAVTLDVELVEGAFLSHVAGSLVQQYKDILNPPDEETQAKRVHAARRRSVSSNVRLDISLLITHA